MLNKQITVRDISTIKNGVGNGGKQWFLRKVVDHEGVEFTTFDEYQIGQSYEINYVEEPFKFRDGRESVNRKIIPASQVGKVEEKQKTQGQFDRIEQKIDDVIKLLLK